LGRALPQFFHGQKKQKNYDCANAQFVICFPIILRNPPIEIGKIAEIPGVPKNGPVVYFQYFDDNFGKYGPILTIFSLLQQEIYDAQHKNYT